MKIAEIENWGEETRRIKNLFERLGCDLVGVAPAKHFPEMDFFENWLDRGFAGEMDYLQRHREKSVNPRKILPSVQTVLVCGQLYETPLPHETAVHNSHNGWISRYAWGEDYHDRLLKILRTGVEWLNQKFDDLEYRFYVDTGPTRDRIWARYAGLGWFGKNTCFINQKVGSYFFLGEIFLNLPLQTDKPAAERCGTCTRCLESCPTKALVEPGVLDARKCISYLTIELKTAIPKNLRHAIGTHLFGCDICQDVCPWNRRAPQTREDAYLPREGFYHPDLGDFYKWVRDEFPDRFKKSPLKRTKQRGLLRNVAVAMGNSGQKEFKSALAEMAESDDPLVREHAQWGLEKLKNRQSKKQRVKPTKSGKTSS